MNSSTVADGICLLRSKLAVQNRSDDSDGQLLHAFASRRDDSAFAVLVRRHGPMVMNVCRRVLGHHQDAEDAFQATFLVLARNAATLRDKTALAGFLHGTAYRTARTANQSAARRRKHEGALGTQTQPRSPVNPVEELSWREARAAPLPQDIPRGIANVILAHRIALDPTYTQQAYFARAAGTARFAWNWALAEWDRRYAAGQKSNGRTLKAAFNAIKYDAYPWLKDIHRDAHAPPFANMHKAFAAWNLVPQALGEVTAVDSMVRPGQPTGSETEAATIPCALTRTK